MKRHQPKAKPQRGKKHAGVKAKKAIDVNALAGALPLATPIIEKPVYVGRLRTVADWHLQVGKIFRDMRKGLLRTEIGTRLTYVARVGADLAKFQDELQELMALRAQLEAARAGSGLGLGYAAPNPLEGSQALSGDLLPAENQGEGP